MWSRCVWQFWIFLGDYDCTAGEVREGSGQCHQGYDSLVTHRCSWARFLVFLRLLFGFCFCVFVFWMIVDLFLILWLQPARPEGRSCECTSRYQSSSTPCASWICSFSSKSWTVVSIMCAVHVVCRPAWGFKFDILWFFRILGRQRKPSSIWSWPRPSGILRMCVHTSKLSPSGGFVVVLGVLLRLRHATPMDRDVGPWSQLPSCWVYWRMLRAMQRCVQLQDYLPKWIIILVQISYAIKSAAY